MGIFNDFYTFFYDWLFAGNSVAISPQMQEFACVVMSVVGCLAILWVAFMPIKAIVSAVLRGF